MSSSRQLPGSSARSARPLLLLALTRGVGQVAKATISVARVAPRFASFHAPKLDASCMAAIVSYPCTLSDARGVAHVAACRISPPIRGSSLRSPERLLCPPVALATVGVGQAAATMWSCKLTWCPDVIRAAALIGSAYDPPPVSRCCGVGHGAPVEPASDVRGVHGASRDINPPAGVTFARQISLNSVEPTVAKRARNLLSHNDKGPAGADETKEVGPQMPCVVGAAASACD